MQRDTYCNGSQFIGSSLGRKGGGGEKKKKKKKTN